MHRIDKLKKILLPYINETGAVTRIQFLSIYVAEANPNNSLCEFDNHVESYRSCLELRLPK
jgi:hypothetical protein